MARRRRPVKPPQPVSEPHDQPDMTPGPDMMSADPAAQTTGRYLVVYRDDALDKPKEVSRSLSRLTGIRHLAIASDFGDRIAKADDVGDADGLYFPALGVAVVPADDTQLQSLMGAAGDEASSILAIEPEYVFYALAEQAGPPLEYLRGYRDAVNHLYEALAGTTAEAAELGIAAALQDTAQFTWGLQATRVNTTRFTGQGVKVAVLDTGMDLQHPDFRGRRLTAQSFIPGQAVQDGQGHGTHCVGTSCGPQRPPSGVRRYGCAANADIFVGKVLSNTGSSAGSSVLSGMNWAVTNQCQVLSMSLGARVDQVSQAFEQAGQRALQAGCLIVAAAGNNANRSGGNFGFVEQPANSPSIMAVAALDSQLRVGNFSARSSVASGAGGKVDVAAPGVSVFSSVPVSRGTHASFNGTSMATPHVAGIAALWCHSTGRTGMALWTTVIQNARRIPGDARDIGSGLAQAPQ
jgi:subtilisin